MLIWKDIFLIDSIIYKVQKHNLCLFSFENINIFKKIVFSRAAETEISQWATFCLQVWILFAGGRI